MFQVPNNSSRPAFLTQGTQGSHTVKDLVLGVVCAEIILEALIKAPLATTIIFSDT
jgi:hypothetical protein